MKIQSLLCSIFTAALFMGLGGCRGAVSPQKEEIRVAAASDLAKAFPEIGARFQEKTGHKIVFSFGATGTLAAQIEQGAPFDVFAAANSGYLAKLASKRLASAKTIRPFAIGRLALWASSKAPLALEDLKNPQYAHIALANPEHAPYGMAAKQALEKAGLWSVLKPRLVFGSNVQQAFQFAREGSADVAIVSRSLIANESGSTTPVPENLYAPLRQELAPLTASKRQMEAQAFVDFVCSAEGGAILKKFGFETP